MNPIKRKWHQLSSSITQHKSFTLHCGKYLMVRSSLISRARLPQGGDLRKICSLPTSLDRQVATTRWRVETSLGRPVHCLQYLTARLLPQGGDLTRKTCSLPTVLDFQVATTRWRVETSLGRPVHCLQHLTARLLPQGGDLTRKTCSLPTALDRQVATTRWRPH